LKFINGWRAGLYCLNMIWFIHNLVNCWCYFNFPVISVKFIIIFASTIDLSNKSHDARTSFELIHGLCQFRTKSWLVRALQLRCPFWISSLTTIVCTAFLVSFDRPSTLIFVKKPSNMLLQNFIKSPFSLNSIRFLVQKKPRTQK